MPAGVIVADDLTGAADACGMFVARGFAGAVLLDADALGDSATAAAGDPAAAGATRPRADWLAISTDTRAQPASRAAERVREVVRQVHQAFPTARAFKKIDSTLRGHLGAEIDAAMDAWHVRLAIVAPAFPEMGRTVEQGMLHVTGPGAPPPCDVAARLEAQGLHDCRRLTGAAEVGPHSYQDAMISAVRDGARVLVCDAIDDRDLDAIVAAGLALEDEAGANSGRILWVGSAGLARALAVSTPASVHAPMNAHEPQFGSIVFLIGSDHPVTLDQQRYLLHGPEDDAIALAAVYEVDRITQRIDRGEHVFVDIGPGVSGDAIERIMHAIIERPIGGLVMSGGDTATRLCRAVDAIDLTLGGEVRRGIPWGWLFTRSGLHWPIVLKSGGFGDDRALHDAFAFLSREDGLHADADASEQGERSQSNAHHV